MGGCCATQGNICNCCHICHEPKRKNKGKAFANNETPRVSAARGRSSESQKTVENEQDHNGNPLSSGKNIVEHNHIVQVNVKSY
jgi:hypothetical protein